MRYLQYFFYIGWHWGFRLAYFIIRLEIKGEKKYGIRTIGMDDLSDTISEEDRGHINVYEPVNYYTASRLFNYLQAEDRKTTLLDTGCGKGRVLAIAATHGFTDIIGIEFSKRLYEEAAKVRDIVKAQYPDISIGIECIDARQYAIPESVGVIFLFNPFDDLIMEKFIKKVLESLRRRDRPLKVLYANPECKDQWLKAGFKEIASFEKMRYLHGSVLERR